MKLKYILPLLAITSLIVFSIFYKSTNNSQSENKSKIIRENQVKGQNHFKNDNSNVVRSNKVSNEPILPLPTSTKTEDSSSFIAKSKSNSQHSNPDSSSENVSNNSNSNSNVIAALTPKIIQFNLWANSNGLNDGKKLDAYEIAEGIELAKIRRAALKELIKVDPKLALENKISYSLRNHLPEEILPYLEDNFSNKGNLDVIISTPIENEPAIVRRIVTIKDKTYDGYVYGRRLQQSAKVDINLHGIAIDNVVAVDENPVRVVSPEEITAKMLKEADDKSCVISGKKSKENNELSPVEVGGELIYLCSGGHITSLNDQLIAAENSGQVAANGEIAQSAWTYGNKTNLYIIVRFSDQPSEPQSFTDATNMLASLNAFIQLNSYGLTSITSTVTPCFVLPHDTAYYVTNGDFTLQADARAVATANGYNYTSYNLDAVRWNGGPGGYGGQAYVGARGCWLKSSSVGVAAHEYGHNYGLWHANFWGTSDGTAIGAGSNGEYGDSFDTMGSAAAGAYHFNVYERWRLDWMPTANVPLFSTNGDFQIYAFDKVSSADAGKNYGLRIQKETGGFNRVYWLDFRQLFTSNAWLTSGVDLHWAPWTNSNGGSQLLDTTPKSPSGKSDSAIAIGRTFEDSAANLYMTPTGKGGTTPESIWVTVNKGPFPGNQEPLNTTVASSTSVAVSTPVTFTCTASDPDGDSIAYYWDFGDNTNSFNNLSTQTKSYGTAGVYAIKCTVSDKKGGYNTQTVLVTVGTPVSKFIIQGKVLDESSNPVENAVVTWGSATTLTNNSGDYHLTNLAAGSNNVIVYKQYHAFAVNGFANPVVVGPDASNINFTATRQYVISASAAYGGTISPTGEQSVASGTSKTFTMTPNAGYEVDTVIVDGINVGKVTSYTFSNVNAHHTINATFKIIPVVTYTINASAGAKGSISPSGNVVVNSGANQTFTFTPSATYVVDTVTVDGVNIGSVTSYTFTNVVANHTISVTFIKPSAGVYTISSSTGLNGSISPIGAVQVTSGANQTFTITPIAGFTVNNVVVDGASVGAVTSYTFTNVTANHTIAASFRVVNGTTYTITASAGANGSISPSGAVVVTGGANQTFTFTPSAGYAVDVVTVDGASVGSVTSYTFSNVVTNHTISATFKIKTYTITASAAANGTISPSGSVIVNGGASQTFTITPNTGYIISNVTVNGSIVGPVSSYTFSNVNANQTISATFQIKTYTIAASSGANGSITPSGSVSVNHGASQAFTITPGAGYGISDVLVDGVSVGAVTSYTFSNVTAAHSISATFVWTFPGDPNLIVHWKLDEASGTSAADSSGHAFTGSLVNGPVWTTGKDAGALSFDGTNDMMNLNSNSNLKIPGDITIAFWMNKASEATDYQRLVGKGATVRNYGVWEEPGASKRILFQQYNDAGSAVLNLYSTTNVEVATWYHVACVVSGTNAYIYINGVLNASGTRSGLAGTSDDPLTIAYGNIHTYFPGLLDDIRIYNRAISAAEVLALNGATTYTITASAGANGSISPSGSVSVSSGANQTFTITPSAGYDVDTVLVDGVSVGSVTSYTFSNVTATHTISATFKIKTYTITASSGANGSITPTGSVSVNHGSNQTFTMTPAAGYSVNSVLVDGVNVGAVTSYTFSNVTAPHTISVSYQLVATYTISASAGANGSISPTGSVVVSSGANQTFTMTPAAGYQVDVVTVDGASVGSVSSYTFSNVTAAHTISVTFKIKTYTITASSGANGSISPSGSVTVNHGSSQTFTMTPAAGYQVDVVTVNGASVGSVTSYTFSNVTSAHTISVTFKIKTYVITASSGANGSISPTGSVSVNHGSNQTFTMTPSAGYQVSSVLVDGVSVGAVTSYTFSNVTAAHTISVSYQLIVTYTITASSGANGSISPIGSVVVSSGASQTFTMTPAAGYQVDVVTVDGASVGSVSSYTFSNVTAAHTISVTFKIKTYTITASSGANGSISPSGSVTVNHGSNQTFTMTPAAGYQVDVVTVNGASVGSVTSYTFSNVTAAHTISVTFKIKTYVITASSGANGSISPTGSVSVNHGSNQTFTMTPSAGYQVSSVLVDGVSVGAVTSYTFSNVTAAHTISVSYQLIVTYTITASSGANGSISPTGSVVVSSGASQTFTMTPAAGYQVDVVTVDGASVGSVSSYTFSNVTAAHTISVTFKIKTYTITASSGANGSISPSGSVTVNHGSNQTFTMTPAAGYQVDVVTVNGASVGSVTSYTFSNVTAAHTISVTFKIKTYVITASSGANGSISPTGSVSVNHGSNQTFTMTPSAGYQVSSVLVDGVSVGAVTSYTFSNVTAAHTISVSYQIIAANYTITASAGANGSISPSGSVVVSAGSNQTFSMTPAANYQVDTVLVDGVSVGSVTSYTFSNVTSAHTISVTFKLITYTITASSGANGSISPTGSVVVNHGSNQTFSMTPAAGYQVDVVTVDGASVGSVSSYTFSNVTAAHTISVTFKVLTYTISASSGSNGSISPTGSVVVNHGSNQAFTMTPAAGYQVSAVLVDGVNVGSVTSYTFSNVTAPHTISVTYQLIATYTISASAGSNGSISPSGSVVVTGGANQSFTITPAAGYQVDAVTVDGASVGSVTSYTFSNVTANHTISATFKILTYTITASAGANGSISPSGSVSVNHGTNKTFTISPVAGYQVDTVTVDGVSVGAVTTYTFSNVTAAHTISATFIIKTYTITASSGANGSISPTGSVIVTHGANQTFTMTPAAGYQVASVLVDGVSVGSVTTYTFSNVTSAHTISVTYQLIVNYTITASAGANGSISPSGSVSVVSNSSQTFTMIPAAGYQVNTVLVDGVSVGAVSNYTFSNINASHTISVSFQLIVNYTITASAGPNGSISPSGSVSVVSGSSQTFTMTPAAGFQVDTVLVDGASVGSVASYTFGGVTSGHTISVTFKPNTYTITSSAGANGSISPSGSVVVNHGSSQSFTITPNAGYTVDFVTVDGASVGAVTTYTFNNVTAAHNISVTFKLITFTITASAGANGSISPSGAVVVNQGANQTFTITPAANFTVDAVIVDGANVGSVTTYTFNNVTAPHTISVTFKTKTYTISTVVGLNGSISPTSAIVNQGASQTFVITPVTGFQVDTVLVDGTSVGAVTTYTFTNVTAPHTISVTFKQLLIKTFTITATAGINGSISPSGSVAVNENTNQTFTMSPAVGYEVDTVTVDGTSVGAVTNYTFNNVIAAHTISVTFKVKTNIITATAGANGTISPTGSVSVNYGSNQTFTITPAAGYLVNTVLVDGVSVGAILSYTFSNVTAAHTISVTFKATSKTYTITATSGINGSISPSGNIEVPEGARQIFYMKPNSGFQVKEVLVDGVSVGVVTKFIFKNVRAPHTISVSFKQITKVNTFAVSNTVDPITGTTTVGSISISSGTSPSFAMTPIEGFEVTQILVDGEDANSFSGSTFSTVELIIVASDIITKKNREFDFEKNFSTTGNALIEVNRFGGTEGELDINYEASRYTLVDSSDMTMVTGELHWDDGDATKKAINFPILADGAPETEVFSVKLISINEPVVIGENDPDTGSITPDNGSTASSSGGSGGGGGCNYQKSMTSNDQAGNMLVYGLMALLVMFISRRKKNKLGE